MHAKIAAQQAGLGVGFLPRHLIKEQIRSGTLVVKACEVPRSNTMLYLGWRRQSQPGEALKWFSQALSAYNWPAVFGQDPVLRRDSQTN